MSQIYILNLRKKVFLFIFLFLGLHHINYKTYKMENVLQIESISKEILHERIKQDEKFGNQKHHPFAWLAILGEEVGEANKAALETEFDYKGSDKDFSGYRKELIQVAAVAVAMIQNIDNNPIQYK